MENHTISGTGPNPDGPVLPVGLGMRLAQEPRAMQAFASMTNAQKEAMIAYIQSGTTGDEAKARLHQAVSQLRDGQAYGNLM